MVARILALFKNPEAVMAGVAFFSLGIVAHQFLPQAHSGGVTKDEFNQFQRDISCSQMRYALDDLRQTHMYLVLKVSKTEMDRANIAQMQLILDDLQKRFDAACL